MNDTATLLWIVTATRPYGCYVCWVVARFEEDAIKFTENKIADESWGSGFKFTVEGVFPLNTLYEQGLIDYNGYVE